MARERLQVTEGLDRLSALIPSLTKLMFQNEVEDVALIETSNPIPQDKQSLFMILRRGYGC